MADLEFTGGVDFSEGQSSLDAFAEGAASSLDAALAGAVSGVLDALGTPIPITADASQLPIEIESSVADVQLQFPVDADTSLATAAVADLVTDAESTPIEVAVEVDTGNANNELDDLGTSGQDAAEGLDAASAAGSTIATTGSLATGSLDALSNTVGGLATRAGGLGVVVGAGTVLLGAFTGAAVNSLGASQRLSDTLGDLADGVEHIRVGDLNVALGDLAVQTGSSGSGMRNAAVDAFELGNSFGKSREESAEFSAQILALAGRSVALNPSLGETGDVAERLVRAFASGRDRGLLPFQLGLSSVDIAARAAQIALADGRTEVDASDKAFAGAQLAVEKFGGSLQEQIAQGAQNPILAARQLTKEFSSVTTELAKPLVAPALDALRAALPAVENLGEALSNVAAVALPVLTGALDLVGPAIVPVVEGFIAMKAAALAASVVSSLAGGLELLTGLLPAAAAGIESFAGGVAGASIAIETAAPFVGLLVGGLALAGSALGLFGGDTDAATAKVNDFGKALEDANGKLDETAKKAARSLLEEKGQIDDLGRAGVTLNDVLDAVSGTSANQRDILGDLEDATYSLEVAQGSDAKAQNARGVSLDTLKQRQEDYLTSLRKTNPELAAVAAATLKDNDTNTGFIHTLLQLATASDSTNTKLKERKEAGASDVEITRQQNDAMQTQAALNGTAYVSLLKYADGSGTATQALQDLSAAQQETNSQISIYKTQIEGLLGLQGDVTAAQAGVTESNGRLYESLVKNGLQFDVNTAAGAANIQSLLANRDSYVSLAEATYKSELASRGETQARADADAVLATFKQKLDDTLFALGLNTDQVNALNIQLGLVTSPPPVVIPVTIAVALAWQSATAEAIGLAALGGGANINPNTTGSAALDNLLGIKPPGAAEGMYVPASNGGTLVNVGEAGYDEAVISPRNIAGARESLQRLGIYAQVYPQAPTYAAASGQGGHTDNSVNVQVDARGQERPEEIASAIGTHQRAVQLLSGT